MHLWSLIFVQSISSPWPRTQWYKGWDHGQFNNICSDCSGCDVDVSAWNFSTATEIAALHPRSNIAFRLDLLILWQIRTSVDSSVLSVTDTGELQFLDVFGHGKWGRSALKGQKKDSYSKMTIAVVSRTNHPTPVWRGSWSDYCLCSDSVTIVYCFMYLQIVSEISMNRVSIGSFEMFPELLQLGLEYLAGTCVNPFFDLPCLPC